MFITGPQYSQPIGSGMPMGYGMAPVTPTPVAAATPAATAPPPSTSMNIASGLSNVLGILGDTAGKVIVAGAVPTAIPVLPPPTNGALQIHPLTITPKPPTA